MKKRKCKTCWEFCEVRLVSCVVWLDEWILSVCARTWLGWFDFLCLISANLCTKFHYVMIVVLVYWTLIMNDLSLFELYELSLCEWIGWGYVSWAYVSEFLEGMWFELVWVDYLRLCVLSLCEWIVKLMGVEALWIEVIWVNYASSGYASGLLEDMWLDGIWVEVDTIWNIRASQDVRMNVANHFKKFLLCAKLGH